MLEHLACCRTVVMAMMALDGTFDVLLERLELHKTVAVNYYYWAFGIDLLEQLLQLSKPAMVEDDVMHTRVNHRNVLVKQLTLYTETKK